MISQRRTNPAADRLLTSRNKTCLQNQTSLFVDCRHSLQRETANLPTDLPSEETDVPTEELVVLVDESNTAIGTCPKALVHTGDTPLHRAFSCFVFNQRGELLLQQRSRTKKTWPLVWSNSCCGHPQPEESSLAAVGRRLKQELRLQPTQIFEVLPDYRYRAEHLGVVENEICPVYVCWSEQTPVLDPAEVEACRYTNWSDFIAALRDPTDTDFDGFSPWCREESLLLDESEQFQQLWKLHTLH